MPSVFEIAKEIISIGLPTPYRTLGEQWQWLALSIGAVVFAGVPGTRSRENLEWIWRSLRLFQGVEKLRFLTRRSTLRLFLPTILEMSLCAFSVWVPMKMLGVCDSLLCCGLIQFMWLLLVAAMTHNDVYIQWC